MCLARYYTQRVVKNGYTLKRILEMWKAVHNRVQISLSVLCNSKVDMLDTAGSIYTHEI